MKVCEIGSPQELLDCPSCTEIFFSRINRVQIGRLVIVIIRRYLLRKCLLGLALGHHVHSMTLLPGEEVEIEIVRRSKYSRALHEQRSVESEFRSELQSTARDEWSSEEEINKKVGGGVDFSFFGIGVKASGGYTKREKTAEEHFREIVSKTSSRVSRKFEVAIDIKSEVENQYRSLRRISNPNGCQPVTYNYFQMAKKYKTELILTDIRFDILLPQLPQREPPLPPILREPLNEVLFSAQSPYRQNLNLRVVSPPPSWTLAAGAAAETPSVPIPPPVATTFSSLRSFAQAPAQFVSPVAAISALPSVRVPVEPPEVMELTKDELLDKIQAAREAGEIGVDIKEFHPAFEEFLSDDFNQPGVRATYEYCIDTNGLHVETTVSECSACDEYTLRLRRLEVKKARAEVELLKRQLREEDDEENG